MSQPLVSVVIPTYNRAQHIIDAVETVFGQTYENIETVVVVDGSLDETLSLLEAYKANLSIDQQDKLQIIYQENAGVSAARNNGIAHARGYFIALLDDDDKWSPQKIDMQMRAAKQFDDGAPFLITTDYNELENGETIHIECDECMSFEGQFKRGMFPPPSTWLFSREAYDMAGGFDEQMNAGEDQSMLFWMRRKEIPFVNVSEPLATYDFPPPSKAYREQEESHAKSLAMHGEWLQGQLSIEDFAKSLEWYERILPPEMYEEAVSGLGISTPKT